MIRFRLRFVIHPFSHDKIEIHMPKRASWREFYWAVGEVARNWDTGGKGSLEP